MRKIALFALLTLTLLAALSGCNFTLAEDVTPPPGWHSTPVPPTPEVERLYPLTPPDPQAGAEVYQARCADCHGPQAQGDGPLAEQLPKPPAPLADPDFDAEASPADWFLTITQGRMDDLMPSFADLPEAQRWDVIAYLMTLRYDEALRERGQQVYALRCASCHNDSGEGGPLTWEETAGLSDAQIRQIITQGTGKMEPVEGVKEEDLPALVAYTRTLGLAAAPVAEATATPQATAATPEGTETASGTAQPTETATTPEVQENRVTIQGQVTNGSGGDVPQGLTVVLHGFDNDSPGEVVNLETQTDAEGRFTFKDVEAPFHRVFVVSVEYQGAVYGSDWAVATGDPVLELPVTIYDTTTDTSTLRVDRLHIFFEFPTPETIRVIELYVVSNTGEKTVVAEEPGQPVVTFDLPDGATNLQFQDGELGGRYVTTEEGFGDTRPVPPGNGAYQVVFAYELPYAKRAEIRHAVTLPTDSVALLAPTNGVKVKSDMLEDAGVRQIEGQSIHLYQSEPLQPGDEIVFEVSGKPKEAPEGGPTTTRTGLAIGLVVFGVGLIALGVVLWKRQQVAEEEVWDEEDEGEAGAPVDEDDPETLMDAILNLDDLYKQGRLPEEAYRRRRAELKARLAELLQAQEAEEDTPSPDEESA